MCHEALVACGRQLLDLRIDEVWDPQRVIVVLDHSFPAATERMAASHQMARAFVDQFGITTFLGLASIVGAVADVFKRLANNEPLPTSISFPALLEVLGVDDALATVEQYEEAARFAQP
jgi:homoaconitase/3-isopropylmalate dehydratase large subunit